MTIETSFEYKVSCENKYKYRRTLKEAMDTLGSVTLENLKRSHKQYFDQSKHRPAVNPALFL
ncbi:hypothetical protein DOY81_006144 [Sarcophaga bullata]|nr:hypothetical protein DOY81_006144 [Sarcophaga bullata]